MLNAPVGLVLASASPRRRELLRFLGLDFEVAASGVEEEGLMAGSDPLRLAAELAQLKVESIAPRFAGRIILAADTVIDLDGEALGKPASEGAACRMLGRLAGRTHRVITGLACGLSPDGRIRVTAVSTEVKMREASPQEIERYVKTGEPMDKAGAYAIQGLGSSLVESVRGCYNNVVGLPLCEVFGLLCDFGADPTAADRVCLLPGGALCPRLCASGC